MSAINYIYLHVAVIFFSYLNLIIENKTNIIIYKMFYGDWQYMPFKKLNNKT